MASKQCDNFEYDVEDDLKLIEIYEDLKPPTNTPVPSPSKISVAWGLESEVSVENVYRPRLSDISESNSTVSVFSNGNAPENRPIESDSESDISMYNWKEKPKIKPRVFVPKQDLSGLVTPRDSGVVSVASPRIHCTLKRKCPSVRKFFCNLCNLFRKCVKC